MTVKVRFADDAIIHEIDHEDDYLSAEEIENVWLTKKEYREIRYRDASIIMSLVRKKRVPEDDDNDDSSTQHADCIRGLEGRTPVATDSKKLKFVEVVYVVLDEQERQKAFGISDPNKIAHLYRKNTKHCGKVAKRQGRKDWLSINPRATLIEEEEDVSGPFIGPAAKLGVTEQQQELQLPKKAHGPKHRFQRFLGRSASQKRV
jgi:hypothetical protein